MKETFHAELGIAADRCRRPTQHEDFKMVATRTVTANRARYATIKWQDGHQGFSDHKEMKRVELLAAKR
jgi:hypothetical protein